MDSVLEFSFPRWGQLSNRRYQMCLPCPSRPQISVTLPPFLFVLTPQQCVEVASRTPARHLYLLIIKYGKISGLYTVRRFKFPSTYRSENDMSWYILFNVDTRWMWCVHRETTTPYSATCGQNYQAVNQSAAYCLQPLLLLLRLTMIHMSAEATRVWRE